MPALISVSSVHPMLSRGASNVQSRVLRRGSGSQFGAQLNTIWGKVGVPVYVLGPCSWCPLLRQRCDAWVDESHLLLLRGLLR